MSMVQKYLEYFEGKLDDLSTDDKHWQLKSVLYSMAIGVTDGLALVGIQVFLAAGINLARGKGWTVCPKD